MSIPHFPQYKELYAALTPYHAQLVGESYLGKRRPVYDCTDVQVYGHSIFGLSSDIIVCVWRAKGQINDSVFIYSTCIYIKFDMIVIEHTGRSCKGIPQGITILLGFTLLKPALSHNYKCPVEWW